jgi:hypothetical protein
VAKQFALNFNGVKTKVGTLEFEFRTIHCRIYKDTNSRRKMVQSYVCEI